VKPARPEANNLKIKHALKKLLIHGLALAACAASAVLCTNTWSAGAVAPDNNRGGWKGCLARVASKLRGPLGDPAGVRLPTGETYSNE
jgi:hypothetical protein